MGSGAPAPNVWGVTGSNDLPNERPIALDNENGRSGRQCLYEASTSDLREPAAHCRWLPCRDRAYRTVVPSSARTTTGASTDKISHHTSTRPPKLAAANYDRSRATRRAQRGIVNKFGGFATLAANGRASSFVSSLPCCSQQFRSSAFALL